MLYIRAFGERERILDVNAQYRTVLSIVVWPSKICTARRFPVCL
jgi:hypothetical protein